MTNLKQIFSTLSRHDGSSILETALVMPVMLLMVMSTVDFGHAFCVAIEVASAAHAGAVYGIQNPTDTAGMEAASKLDAPDVSTLTPVATYGCECSDGSAAVASCTAPPACTYNYVSYVSVTTTATYTPLIQYPGIPHSLTLTSTARMRAGGD
jgi:Flp pilus assembly protein TadG